MQRGTEEGSELILVVDDDLEFGESLCDVLGVLGHRSVQATDGQGALDHVRDRDPGIALIDVHLGPEDGVRLVERLKAVRPEIVCMMLTAYASKTTAIEALRRGAYDFLEKPLDLAELRAALDRALEFVRMARATRRAAKLVAEREGVQASLNTVLRHFVDRVGAGGETTSAVIVLDEAERIRFIDPRLRELLFGRTDPTALPMDRMASAVAATLSTLVAKGRRAGHARTTLPVREEPLDAVAVPLLDERDRTRGYCVLVEGLEAAGPISRAVSEPTGDPRWDLLSPRQKEAGQAALSGRPTKVIAKDLGISAYTVRNHLREVYRAFGVRSRGELIHTLLRRD